MSLSNALLRLSQPTEITFGRVMPAPSVESLNMVLKDDNPFVLQTASGLVRAMVMGIDEIAMIRIAANLCDLCTHVSSHSVTCEKH